MKIIPAPQKYVKLNGNFCLNEKTNIFANSLFSNEANCFAQELRQRDVNVNFVDNLSDANVIFALGESGKQGFYSISIDEGLINVTACDVQGCFYAVVSLCQLLGLSSGKILPCENCYIEDKPLFDYRSLHFDVARHFFPKETVKTILDLMSLAKLNYFHFHLTDDQGFRVQIDKYPLLTEIGSTRQGSEVVKGKRFVDNKAHSGFYTKEDVREIVAYAKSKHIEVVPEFDVPGHLVAVLSAYPEYSCAGEGITVRQKWGISKDLLCAGNEGSYTFICDILDELCELFPCKYFHLGGDEAPKDRWCNCKKCSDKMAELKLSSFNELQTYMVERFRQHLEKKGKTVLCWNDGITSSTSEKIVSQAWAPFTDARAKREINNGRVTVLSPYFTTYFDYPYAMTPLRKTYKYRALKGVKRKCKDNVLGVEGTLWTEYVDNEDKLFFNLLPRMFALSEMAWGTNGNYKSFKKRIKDYYPIFEQKELCYNKTATKYQLLLSRLNTVMSFRNTNADIELDRQTKKK